MNRQDVARPARVVQPQAVEDEHVDEWEGQAEESRGPLMRFLFNPYLTLVSRLVLGLVFLLAGLTKLGMINAFTASINSYEMPLPGPLVTLMAYTLPPLELALGLLLLVGLWTRLSGVITGGLMVVFLIAMVQAMFRGLSPDCGCFGGPTSNPVGQAVMTALGPVGTFLSTERVGPDSLIRDLIFLAMALHLVFVPTFFGVDSWRRRTQAEAEGWDDEGGELQPEE
jgi:uncharacterized membrane protein YphA (DoxX/SURF4 family)